MQQSIASDDPEQDAPVVFLLRGRLEKLNQAQLAEEIGVSPQYLSEILNYKKPPSQRVLDFLNLERVVTYRPKSGSETKKPRPRRR